MMRNFYPQLFKGQPEEAEANDLAQRTFEFAEFLVKKLGVTDVGAKFSHKVTYHDGCHALRELRLKEEPRQLLRAVKGLELIETEEGESCCGFGGLFSAKFPMISTAMVQVKGGALVRTGAEFVVSSDPSCLLQIGGWLSREGKPIRPLHLSQVLANEAS
jgi:L-lactate dehydrogenase complex protein LldE